MAHLFEKARVAPKHVAPDERLTIDLHQREALKSRMSAAPPTCNAEGPRWGNGHWDKLPAVR
jgi:hypothetical protein